MTRGLDWQTIEIPFRAGLRQKADDRARPQPFLDVADDVQFEEEGGVQPRFPFDSTMTNIFGGGTISGARRIEPVNGELVLFTDSQIYSWNAQLSAWVLRGTHLAVAVDERPRFVTTDDQFDCDRAELSNTVLYVWSVVGAFTMSFAAAIDKSTGSVLMPPTALNAGGTAARPRVVALATKILVFFHDATNLRVYAVDPASPATAIAGASTTVLATVSNLFYDVVRAGTQDLAVGAVRRNVTTSHEVFKVTPALVVTTATKARTADGPLAVATIADGTQMQVVRGNSTNIQGDLLTTSTLADVHTGQAIGTATGTPVNQIAVEFATTTAHVFWSFLETAAAGSTTFGIKKNTVTTSNVVGTQSTMVLRLGVASRAFLRSGRVFVWGVFASDSTSFGSGSPLGIRAQLQNTYFLYRDDGLLVSKAVFHAAGGFSASTGRLPGVATTSGAGNDFAWCGAVRRVIDLGGNNHTGYAARSLIDIAFSFDSNEARRCARIGRTLYLTGGIVMQYDGLGVAELGFLVYPWAFAVQDSGVAGNIAAGTYSWKSTLKFQNAVFERERSTTATGEQLTLAASRFVIITIFNLFVTLKTTRKPSIEIWRTATGGQQDAPSFLVTSQDPSATTGDNCYIVNDTTTAGPVFADNLADANLIKREANPENGSVLESLAPPGAKIVIATDTRLFLGAVAGDPDAVWYSRFRSEGDLASFHDRLRVLVPRVGGDMTGLTIHAETLVVFRETAIYAFPGDGFDNQLAGVNYGPSRIISLDVGAVSQESIATTPLGTILKSSKGWYLLRGWDVQYIGAGVSDYDSETVHAVNVVETQHQVRILTSGRMLVWDYLAATEESPLGQWFEWSISDGVHATMWNGTHVYLTATGPKQQLATYTGLTYGLDVETAPIKLSGLQGAVSVRKVQPLGEHLSDHLLWIRIAYNYKKTGSTPDYVDSKVWTPSPGVVGGPLQVAHRPKRPKCESIKVRITAVTDSVRATRATATLSPSVPTSGADWTATLTAASPYFGEVGNTLSLSLVIAGGEIEEDAIEVRDHFAFDLSTRTWTPAIGTIGIAIFGDATVTVGQLEAAITAGTALATITTPDPTPSKTIDPVTDVDLETEGSFTGGAFGAPTGAALKLTSLALEVGIEPGLFRRLPAAQQQ